MILSKEGMNMKNVITSSCALMLLVGSSTAEQKHKMKG